MTGCFSLIGCVNNHKQLQVKPKTSLSLSFLCILQVDKSMKLSIQTLLPGFVVHATVTDVSAELDSEATDFKSIF